MAGVQGTTKLRFNRVGGIPILPALPPWLAMTQGRVWHVKPYSGSDSNEGTTPDQALKTLSQAQTKATADQNDIVLMYAESNTASLTTDYQATTLTWAKDGVHLIGVNSGVPIAQRSRVAFTSTYATASNLFTLSADGCYIANIEFFAGVASASPTGCFLLTGDRNMIENCHIAGIGHADMDTAGAYDLKIDGGEENLFRHCAIGLDSIARGTAANSSILLDSECKRDIFEDCYIYGLTEHATNFVLVKTADITAVDTSLGVMFKNCYFHILSANYAVGATAIMAVTAGLTGYIHVYGCGAVNDKLGTAFKWDVNDSNKIILYGPIKVAADTNSQGLQV